MMKHFCGKCGREVTNEAFCPNCGAKLPTEDLDPEQTDTASEDQVTGTEPEGEDQVTGTEPKEEALAVHSEQMEPALDEFNGETDSKNEQKKRSLKTILVAVGIVLVFLIVIWPKGPESYTLPEGEIELAELEEAVATFAIENLENENLDPLIEGRYIGYEVDDPEEVEPGEVSAMDLAQKVQNATSSYLSFMHGEDCEVDYRVVGISQYNNQDGRTETFAEENWLIQDYLKLRDSDIAYDMPEEVFQYTLDFCLSVGNEEEYDNIVETGKATCLFIEMDAKGNGKETSSLLELSFINAADGEHEYGWMGIVNLTDGLTHMRSLDY